MALHLSSGSLVTLGKDINSDQRVTMKQSARLRGMYVIGKTGSGKTTLLINLILQDIEQGMGVCFFDTHGDPINAILARLPATRTLDRVVRKTTDDVILLDPLDKASAFGLNLFQCNPTDEEQVSRTVSYILEVFAKLFTKSGVFDSEAVNMELTLRNAAYALIDNLTMYGTTMAEIPLLIDDEEARIKLMGNLTIVHSEAKRFWNRYHRWKMADQFTMAGSTARAVNKFLSNMFIRQVVGQSISTLNFSKIMDERKILLVKLPRRDRELTNLVGSIIIGQIANAAFSREDTPEDERIQFNLYADEYQRFATPTFAELLAEVRKYKIATTVAHQWRQQLDIDNRKATLNAGTLVVFEVIGEDGDELAKQFNVEPQQQLGELRPEMKMEPVVEEYTDKVWEPPEAYQDYLKVIAQFLPLTHKRGMMGHSIQDLSPTSMIEEDYLGNGRTPYTFHEYFNPAYFDERVQEYLLQHIYAPGSTMQNPVLRDPYKLEYHFPVDLPTPASINLENEDTFFDSIDLSLAPEYLASLKAWENKTDPKYVAWYADTSHRMAESHKYVEELRAFRAWLLARIQEFRKNALYRFDPLGQIGGKKDWAESISEYAKYTGGLWGEDTFRSLAIKRQVCSFELRQRVGKMSFGYWYPTEFPALRKWCIETITTFENAIAPLREEIQRLFDNHLVEKTKERFTGEYKPVYDREWRPGGRYGREERTPLYTLTIKPGSLESMADAEKRIANQLANPAKKYTARVKLENGEEHIIEIEETERFRPAAAPADILARLKTIVDQTRLNYCKKRDEVEQEITARQEALTKPDKKPPRSKQDDDKD